MSNPTPSTTGNFRTMWRLTYFSYLGGSGNDSGGGDRRPGFAASTSLDDVVITGATSSTNFPYFTSSADPERAERHDERFPCPD